MRAIVEGGEVIESLRDRILGRVAADDVLHPETREAIATAGTMLDEDLIETLENAGVDEVKVRTALTCATRHRRPSWPARPSRRSGTSTS